MSKKLNTRLFTQSRVVFLPDKYLKEKNAELNEIIAIYQRYKNVHYWTPHKNYYNRKYYINKTLRIGLFIEIKVKVSYWETKQKCIVVRSISLNGHKRSIRVLKTISDEIEKIIEKRQSFKNKIKKRLFNRR